MVTLKQTLLSTREWSIFRMKDVKPVADKNAIYKEFEEWIEMDDLDQDIYSLAYIVEESEYDIKVLTSSNVASARSVENSFRSVWS